MAYDEASRIFQLIDEPTHRWSDSDLAAMLTQQLNAPLLVGFEALIPEAADKIHELPGADFKCFADALRAPAPPVEILELLKRFAKAARSSSDGMLPEEIATLLYYMAIVAAFARCNQKISRLTTVEILTGVDWALALPWLPAECREWLIEDRAAASPV
jgi:hypothetical protein